MVLQRYFSLTCGPVSEQPNWQPIPPSFSCGNFTPLEMEAIPCHRLQSSFQSSKKPAVCERFQAREGLVSPRNLIWPKPPLVCFQCSLCRSMTDDSLHEALEVYIIELTCDCVWVCLHPSSTWGPAISAFVYPSSAESRASGAVCHEPAWSKAFQSI